MRDYLDFEKPLADIDAKIEQLRTSTGSDRHEIAEEIAKLQKKSDKVYHEIYANLTAIQKVQIARHKKRPITSQYIPMIFDDFKELHGDRLYGDDPAIIGGLASINGVPIVVLGHCKGVGVREKAYRNFGMAKPEGYRKALRIMKLAERFGKPLVTFIDTPGAYPGVGAEERGQSEAIATNLMEMASLATPIICILIGEGGSGGALAIGVGDHIALLEHSIYSVISPEGCAAILWKDGSKSGEAATSLKITAKDLLEMDIIDEIIPEPLGGAHQDPVEMGKRIKKSIVDTVNMLTENSCSIDELVEKRYVKFRKMGVFETKTES